jgi:hypothetical protein
VTCGVPQGSLLCPLLFISYINEVSKYSRFHIYTDDLQIYHSSSVSDLQRCYDEIKMDLQQIHEWATANEWTEAESGKEPPTLLICADVVKVVPRVRNLGFVLNERPTATDHFRKVCQKIYWILRSLRPHAAHTPFEVRRRLVLSLILPHINYGNIVLTGADSASQRRLEAC